jgi:hypothetical protein
MQIPTYGVVPCAINILARIGMEGVCDGMAMVATAGGVVKMEEEGASNSEGGRKDESDYEFISEKRD